MYDTSVSNETKLENFHAPLRSLINAGSIDKITKHSLLLSATAMQMSLECDDFDTYNAYNNSNHSFMSKNYVLCCSSVNQNYVY